MTADAPAETTETTTVETTETQHTDRLPDDHPVVKALNKANKEAEAARRKVAEYEDANRTESERLAARAEEAERRAEAAEREALRHKVIAESQLDPDLHEFVTGDTEDEMRAKAAKLAARAASTASPAPRPDLSQGAKPDETALNSDELLNTVKSKLGIT